MKNLKTVILCLVCFFLFFSCANDFGEGSASVRIDPSVFSRDADGGEFSYVVAIMGETMEPVWKSGSSSSSFTIEFSDLPVGEKAFVYAKFGSPSPAAGATYSGWSDDFVITRGIQPVSLRLKNTSDSSISSDFVFDASTGEFSNISTGANLSGASFTVSGSIPSEYDSYDVRLTFTISAEKASQTVAIPVAPTPGNGSSDFLISIYCESSTCSISEMRADCYLFDGQNFNHKVLKDSEPRLYKYHPGGWFTNGFVLD